MFPFSSPYPFLCGQITSNSRKNVLPLQTSKICSIFFFGKWQACQLVRWVPYDIRYGVMWWLWTFPVVYFLKLNALSMAWGFPCVHTHSDAPGLQNCTKCSLCTSFTVRSAMSLLLCCRMTKKTPGAMSAETKRKSHFIFKRNIFILKRFLPFWKKNKVDLFAPPFPLSGYGLVVPPLTPTAVTAF